MVGGPAIKDIRNQTLNVSFPKEYFQSFSICLLWQMLLDRESRAPANQRMTGALSLRIKPSWR